MSGQPALRLYSLNLAANGEAYYPVDGDYFAVLDASGAFQVRIDDNPYTDFAAGLKVKPPRANPFKSVRIKDTSGGANVISFIVGMGDFEDARLSLSGTVDIQMAAGGNVLNVQGPAGAGDPVPVDVDETPLGANTVFGQSTAAAVALVTPAANVNGLILRNATLTPSSNTAAGVMVAHTAAPAAFGDGHPILAVATDAAAILPRTMLVPAGLGIYVFRYFSTGSIDGKISYDLL